MKTIFLDIDGVLNYNGLHGDKMQKYGFAPELVNNLKELINNTNAKLVISSSWRLLDDINEDIIGGSPWTKVLESKLEMPGIIIDRIGFRNEYNNYYVRTHPDDSKMIIGRYRGYDIRDWLDNHSNIDEFVILDDFISESDIPDLYPYNYIRCSDGFKDYELKLAIQILNKEN